MRNSTRSSLLDNLVIPCRELELFLKEGTTEKGISSVGEVLAYVIGQAALEDESLEKGSQLELYVCSLVRLLVVVVFLC